MLSLQGRGGGSVQFPKSHMGSVAVHHSSVSGAVNHVLHDPCCGTRIHKMAWGSQAWYLQRGVGCKRPAAAACWRWPCCKLLLKPHKGTAQGTANIHGPESCWDTFISSAYSRHEQLGLVKQCFTEWHWSSFGPQSRHSIPVWFSSAMQWKGFQTLQGSTCAFWHSLFSWPTSDLL